MTELLDGLPPNCPLPSSVDCEQEVFVLFNSSAVAPAHCLSQAERGRAKKAVGDSACTRHGLSVFPNLDSCKHQRLLYPRLGPFIGKAKLCAEHGKIAPTPSSSSPAHMTWWPYKNTERHALFVILKEN